MACLARGEDAGSGGWENELLTFPNGRRHDQADTSAYAAHDPAGNLPGVDPRLAQALDAPNLTRTSAWKI